MKARWTLWFRKNVEVNTDPQRRCYDGCHFSSEMRWTGWSAIYSTSYRDELEDSAKAFKLINKDREYKVIPEGDNP